MNKIVINSIFLSSSQFVARLIGFLYLIFLGRQLGVEQFGIYVFTISLVYNFVPVADFGIERLIMRDIAREPEKSEEYFSKLVPLKLLNSGASVILIVLLGLILKLEGPQILKLFIFSLGLIPISLVTLIVSIAAAKEKMKIMSIANIMLILIYAAFGLFIYFIGGGVTQILWAYLIGNSIVLFFLLFNLKQWNLKLTFDIDSKFWLKVIRESWVFGIMNIGAVFYLRMTIILAGIYLSARELGYYGSVYKFIDAGILLPQAVSLAMFPISSRLLREDPVKLKRLYYRGWLVLLSLGLLAFMLIYIFANKIVLLAYGEDYLPAVATFRILGIALVLFFVNSLPGNIIQTSNYVRRFIPYLFFIYIATAMLGFIFGKHGIIYLAWVVVIGESIALVVNNYFVRYVFNKISPHKNAN